MYVYNGHGHDKRSGILHSDLALGRPSSVEGEYPESDACSRLGGQFVRLEYLLEMSRCSMITNSTTLPAKTSYIMVQR